MYQDKIERNKLCRRVMTFALVYKYNIIKRRSSIRNERLVIASGALTSIVVSVVFRLNWRLEQKISFEVRNNFKVGSLFTQ